MFKQLLWSAVVVGGAAVLYFQGDAVRTVFGLNAPAASEDGPSRREAVRVPVIVETVRYANDDLRFEVVGTGRAQRSVTLRAEADGKIVWSSLAAGAVFNEGDELLRLDNTEQRLALELAETQLAEAERIRARFTRLMDLGTTAVARLDEVETAAEVARIQVERARDALADRTVRAPFDGVAGLPEVEVGDWIDSGMEVANFDDRTVLLVEFDLPEGLLGRVAPGLPVEATTPAFQQRTFSGEVVTVDTRLDEASRTAKVRVALPNTDDSLRPGASFTIRVGLKGAAFPLVPELAVRFSRGALYVWRIVDQKAEQIEVQMIRRREAAVLVDGPLELGDRIVVEGMQRLSPGSDVRIINQPLGPTS